MNRMRAPSGEIAWDYSTLAADYERRAPYHPEFATRVMQEAGIREGARIVDMGAGTGRVARAFAELGCEVDAVEPCVEMTAAGAGLGHEQRIRWHAVRAEQTGLPDQTYSAVCFGSSLNVVQHEIAMRETARLLQPDGKLVVLFNHRDLSDPLQQRIEAGIRSVIPAFDHGARRGDPAPMIECGSLFQIFASYELCFRHRTSCSEFVHGFRAHATLAKQAGPKMRDVLRSIEATLHELAGADEVIEIPFVTRLWIARSRSGSRA